MQRRTMRDQTKSQINSDVLWDYLDNNPYELSSVVIHLAWREGLFRREIHNLRWDQIDYDAASVRLPNRTVPLEGKTARQLRMWHNLIDSSGDTEYVACSTLTHRRMAEQSLSRIVRDALDSIGMKEIRLIDLRHDFVRRIMEQYDYNDALKLTGESLTTYRIKYRGNRHYELPTYPSEQTDETDEQKLKRALEENRTGAAGVGLWLIHVAGLSLHAAKDLTWDQVNLERCVLLLDQSEVPITEDLAEVLRNEKPGRSAEDDPHVLLTPKSRKPMDVARLSTITRDILIRYGLANMRGNKLRGSIQKDKVRQQIERFAEERRQIIRQDVEAEFQLSKGLAYSYLSELVEAGKLIHTSKGYFPASLVPPYDEWPSVIKQQIQERGTATVEELAEFLHAGKYSVRRLLRKMATAGELKLVRNGEYRLPNTEK